MRPIFSRFLSAGFAGLVFSLTPPPGPASAEFVLGADVSWSTEQHDRGIRWVNPAGEQKPVLEILKKDFGLEAVRVRVWVDSESGYNDLNDVLVKVRRAERRGLPVMLAFHLSNTWADPEKQGIPNRWRWAEGDRTAMTRKVYQHVFAVLTEVKKTGADVRWVQIGNETTGGLLWPFGDIRGGNKWDWTKRQNVGAALNAGCAAAKAVFKDAERIVHIHNGWDWYHFRDIGLLLQQEQVDYTMLGVSLYPRPQDGWMITNVRSNADWFEEEHGRETMIVEFGTDVVAGDRARQMLLGLRRDPGDLAGVFYWEPQADAGWEGYGKGAWNAKGWKGRRYPTNALRGFTDTP